MTGSCPPVTVGAGNVMFKPLPVTPGTETPAGHEMDGASGVGAGGSGVVGGLEPHPAVMAAHAMNAAQGPGGSRLPIRRWYPGPGESPLDLKQTRSEAQVALAGREAGAACDRLVR